MPTQKNSTNQKINKLGFYQILTLFISFVLFLGSQFTYAQCTIDNLTGGTINNGPFDFLGQTFIPCQDGEISSISVTAAASQNPLGVYELYLAIEPGDGNSIPNTPVASLDFSSSNPPNNSTITFNLASPFPVTTTNTYRFIVDNTSGDVRLRLGQPYSDGSRVQNNNLQGNDLDFEVVIQPPSLNPDVPTLSEWGLIILALLLMTLGTIYLIQSKKEFKVK